ncbi:B-cell receptor CD22 [Solea solea]|uniref:B-cell receptor CD22 n=1 Tax=Solea solea TaxID=90069 RepID=UPI00272AB710|nr:B-cell receptor CD22 [Solea solea]XP_058502944.1 B-cell receptor CD22 [Solea solea]XP_058502945.1 B-cell receptor CD22 [Solea solea]
MQKIGGQVARSCWLLLTLSLKGILAGDWSVRLPSSPICAVTGSSVVFPCSYDYPQSLNEAKGATQLSTQGGGGGEQYKVLSEMWCLGESRCITPRYVFHSAGIFPHPSYQNRVKYMGQPGTKNCSLKISDLRPSDSGNYVFYLITSHPTQKMPEQRGIQLLVAVSSSAVTMSVSPSSGVTEGSSVHMFCCSPSASPQARFRWFLTNSTTPRFNGQVWNINDVTADVSGSYHCQMQTGDRLRDSATQAINVEYSPRNTAVSISSTGDAQVELPVTLTCSSDANPPVHVFSWYQGAACLPDTDKSFHPARQVTATATGRSSNLRRANVRAEQYGQHCCVARNIHGSQTVSVTLTDSRATTPSESTGNRAVLIGLAICVLLAAMALVAFFVRRRQKSSQNQSYALAPTAAPEP